MSIVTLNIKSQYSPTSSVSVSRSQTEWGTVLLYQQLLHTGMCFPLLSLSLPLPTFPIFKYIQWLAESLLWSDSHWTYSHHNCKIIIERNVNWKSKTKMHPMKMRRSTKFIFFDIFEVLIEFSNVWCHFKLFQSFITLRIFQRRPRKVYNKWF